MAAARAMAVGGVMVGGTVISPVGASPAPAAPPAAPPTAPPAAPPVAEPPVRRCVFANCKSDTPAEGLRECPCGHGPHHHFCSIAAGCEADESLCAICLGVPVFVPPEPVAAPVAAPPAPADVPLDDEQIATRLAALHCEWEDVEQTRLRDAIASMEL